MELGIRSKNALILASSKGLGLGVAEELAREGANICICSRNKENLHLAERQIKDQVPDANVYSVIGDLTNRMDRKQMISEARAQLGHIDILVTNSGGPPAGSFEDHDLDTWRKTYDLLLESSVDFIKMSIADMKRNKWGRILTITSMAIKQPVEGLILSNAVRASLLGLVKTLSSELGRYNITVNNLMPGYTKTERLENLFANVEDLSSYTKDIPLGRFAEVSEFSSLAAFLCSERASYITGTSIPVDGGWIKGI